MMFACALPLQFWGDAVQYAVYILKRSPRERTRRERRLSRCGRERHRTCGASPSSDRRVALSRPVQELAAAAIENWHHRGHDRGDERKRAMKVGDRDDEAEGTAPTGESAVAIRDGKWSSSRWWRCSQEDQESVDTSSAQDTQRIELRAISCTLGGRDASDEVVIVFLKRDPLNYGEAMRSMKRAI
ncbi:unnamed protein product [Peronospora effusa]|nr:unnamed protein product [Peronospora effusa]